MTIAYSIKENKTRKNEHKQSQQRIKHLPGSFGNYSSLPNLCKQEDARPALPPQ